MRRKPTAAGQPIRINKRIKTPVKVKGKMMDINNVCNLVSIILKSFDRRFIILPKSDDFTTKDVNFDTLVYKSMAKPPFRLLDNRHDR